MLARLKPLLLYVLFVGAPTALIVIALRLGARIEAPASIAGHWIAHTDGIAFALACRANGPRRAESVDIRQSGTRVALHFREPPNLVLRGTLRAGDLTATSRRGVELRLHAHVDRHAVPNRMTGRLELDCPEPLAVPFHAQRAP